MKTRCADVAEDMNTMPDKTIYIFRHGETDLNRRNYFQGGLVDPPLNSEGETQVAAFFRRYRNVPFDLLISSSLKRSRQSLLPFLPSCPNHIASNGLNEISWGEVDGTFCSGQPAECYASLKRRWRKGDLQARFPKGESPAEVDLRQRKITRRILEGPEECVLVSVHGRAMRIWLARLIDNDLAKMERYNHTNTSLYLLQYSSGKPRIALFNDLSHLG